jgi:hypothetical protein
MDSPELAHVLVESGIEIKTTTIAVSRLDTAALKGWWLEAGQG